MPALGIGIRTLDRTLRCIFFLPLWRNTSPALNLLSCMLCLILRVLCTCCTRYNISSSGSDVGVDFAERWRILVGVDIWTCDVSHAVIIICWGGGLWMNTVEAADRLLSSRELARALLLAVRVLSVLVQFSPAGFAEYLQAWFSVSCQLVLMWHDWCCVVDKVHCNVLFLFYVLFSFSSFSFFNSLLKSDALVESRAQTVRYCERV